jgi:hypothetical protein
METFFERLIIAYIDILLMNEGNYVYSKRDYRYLPMIICIILLSSFLSGCVEDKVSNGHHECLIWSVDQGNGNKTNGTFFVITKCAGDFLKADDYFILYGEEGGLLYPLRIIEDLDSSFSLDSRIKSNDIEWWDSGEKIGYNTTVLNLDFVNNLEDGDKVIIKIINKNTFDEVPNKHFKHYYFIYED